VNTNRKCLWSLLASCLACSKTCTKFSMSTGENIYSVYFCRCLHLRKPFKCDT